METEQHPQFEEVYHYARKSVEYFVRKHADRLSVELKEECIQNALVRTWRAYRKLDETKHWKSFIQRHCRGAVLDYLKSASAFEDGLGAKNDDATALSIRIDTGAEDSKATMEQLLANSSFADTTTSSLFAPHWDLLAKMVGQDEDLHIVAKVLLGFTQENIAQQFAKVLGVHMTRERISQRIYEFFDRLDSWEFYYDPWINQCIYALGLSERYHQADHDNGMGHDLRSFDLMNPMSFKIVQRYYRPNLFDYEQLSSETPSANTLAI